MSFGLAPVSVRTVKRRTTFLKRNAKRYIPGTLKYMRREEKTMWPAIIIAAVVVVAIIIGIVIKKKRGK